MTILDSFDKRVIEVWKKQLLNTRHRINIMDNAQLKKLNMLIDQEIKRRMEQ